MLCWTGTLTLEGSHMSFSGVGKGPCNFVVLPRAPIMLYLLSLGPMS